MSSNRNLCFKRLFNNPNDLERVFKEFSSFACDLEYFGKPYINASRLKKTLYHGGQIMVHLHHFCKV